jgi:hemoglobin
MPSPGQPSQAGLLRQGPSETSRPATVGIAKQRAPVVGQGLAYNYRYMATPDPQSTPFQRIGGQPTVDRIVDSFYDRMSTLPEAGVIRALHSEDLGSIRVTLKKYLAEWLGGPTAYTDERGHPRLRARHLPFSIGNEERDAWMACMRGAMEEVVTDQAAREWILQKLSQVADWMRNRSPGPG